MPAQLGVRVAHIAVHPRPLSLALFRENGLTTFTDDSIRRVVQALHSVNRSDAAGNPTVGA